MQIDIEDQLQRVLSPEDFQGVKEDAKAAGMSFRDYFEAVVSRPGGPADQFGIDPSCMDSETCALVLALSHRLDAQPTPDLMTQVIRLEVANRLSNQDITWGAN